MTLKNCVLLPAAGTHRRHLDLGTLIWDHLLASFLLEMMKKPHPQNSWHQWHDVKRVNALPAAILHLSDSGGEVRAAEAAPIDNAALMKQHQ